MQFKARASPALTILACACTTRNLASVYEYWGGGTKFRELSFEVLVSGANACMSSRGTYLWGSTNLQGNTVCGYLIYTYKGERVRV